jgi:archaellum component FlaC
MPISKVDEEKRLVFGWASLDNIDTQGDLVDAEASREAFKSFRGNIREMHDPLKAAGRLVDFREDTYFDEQEQKFYQGIYVTAYVSKGAPDTWEKVLDGTLSGFSIGGGVQEAKNEIDPETGQSYRKVLKYGLTELSLVDNPANQKANVAGFQKVNVLGIEPATETEEMHLTGELAGITLENVFVCNNCLDDGHGVHKSRDESLTCPMCAGNMIRIGFVESSDPEPRETIKKMVSDHRASREGGVTETMADENTQAEVKTVEVQSVEEVPAPPVTANADEEQDTQARATEEVKDEAVVEEVQDPLTAAVNDLKALTDRIEQSSQARAEEVNELKKSLSDLDTRFEERLSTLADQVSNLETRQSEFAKSIEGIDTAVDEVRKGLTDLDGATALKKSADFDQPAERENPNDIWKGSFLTID